MNPTQPNANTPSEEEISELTDHRKPKTPRSIKKVGWWAVLVLPLLLVITYLTVMFVRNNNVYARVGNAVITKTEFKNARAINEKAAQFTKNEEVLKDVDGFTQKTLVTQANLEEEARKYNVPISDVDIEDQIIKTNKDIQKGATSEDTIKATLIRFNALYGGDYPRNEVLRQYRIGALKDKLAKNILEYRDILMVITRWDYFGGTTKYNQEQADKLSRETLEKKILPLMQQNKSDEEITAVANAGKQPDALNISPETTIVLPMKGINKNNPTSINFQDPKDWDTIEQLKQKGEYSAITRSEGGGYYFIARLSEVGGGSYKNWEDYTSAVQQKAVIYGNSFNVRALISYNQNAPEYNVNPRVDGRLCTIEKSKKNIWGQLTDTLLGARPALADCPGTVGANHKVSFGGIITNSLGQPVSGVSVTVTPRGPSCPVNDPSSTSPRQVSTNGGGLWRTGRDFSCYMYWKVIVSYAGCTYEAPMTLQSGANGTDDPNTWLIMDCVQRQGKISVQHWQIKNDGTRVKANIPQAERFGVLTCITDIFLTTIQAGGLGCNFNEAADATYTFELTAQDYGARMYSNGQGAPKPAPGWTFDHFEIYYPCGGGLAGPWGYAPGGGFVTVSTITVGDACAGPAVDAILSTFYKQVAPPTVDLKINGSNGPVEIQADRSASPSEAKLSWTTTSSPDSCTASSTNGGGFTGSKATGGGSEDRWQDTDTDDKTIDYKITCSNAGGSASDTVTVRYRRRFYPYVQTMNGDVSIKEEIKVTGPTTPTSKLNGSYPLGFKSADDVIIAACQSGGACSSISTKDFCSANEYLFGVAANGDQNPNTNCKAGPYKPQNNPGSIIADSLNKYAPGNSNITCDGKPSSAPYDVEHVSSLPSSGILVSGGPNSCSKILVIDGDFDLNAYTIKKGRATVWVKGNLTIKGNVTTQFLGAYNGTSEIPVVGFVANNITIEPGVTNIEATLYSTDKLNTCSVYPANIAACRNPITFRGIVGAEGGFRLGRNAVDTNARTNNPTDRHGADVAEKFIGSAQAIAFPPPGFEDLISEDSSAVKYFSGEANPKF